MCGTRRFCSTVARAILTIVAIPLGSLVAPIAIHAEANIGVEPGVPPTQVHLLEGDVADVIVHVRASSVCSGTPITATRYVVTAAHCVLDRTGEVVTPVVERDGVDYPALEVLVDPGYHDAPSPQLDAAVLVMDRVPPGPSATLGDTVPSQDSVTLAGFQKLDTDGTLLRPSNSRDHPLPKGVTGGVVRIKTAVAGCIRDASSVEVASSRLKVSCGLVRGASGGGLFAEPDRRPVLVGVISTVSADLSANGVTPLSAVRELLENPGQYAHVFSPTRPLSTGATINRS
jgi:hypothetical protein